MEGDFNLQSGREMASYRFTHEGVFLFENNFLPKFSMTGFLFFCAVGPPSPLTLCQTHLSRSGLCTAVFNVH